MTSVDGQARSAGVAGHIQVTPGPSGEGLASVRRIVQQHGGTITGQSAEGAGGTFTVWLPLTVSWPTGGSAWT